ncbi:reverse transcriptase domain-containing protein [Salinisphaera sp. RV14]|uniref:reverse transcriptase domain-containing protein n=1 Tax=Salinisphaera sp. RV14 TaxID=3454140 RepID=UPI003F85CD9F
MREDPANKAKPFEIPKRWVWEGFQQVRSRKGSPGCDGQSIADFEGDLRNQLYKLWNRMSSGSYMPPPVLSVEIPKPGGGQRPLGIPTVADRVAQVVVKRALEPELERHFHADSYGYRPHKSALGAIETTRQRCWRYAWVVDLDIKAFFDTIDHDLLMQAVRHHTQERWVCLYIERWLKADLILADGTRGPDIFDWHLEKMYIS